MLQILLYFTLNFLGFLFFLFIWNRLPKPRPFDYTTIPGSKLEVSKAEELPKLSIEPGTPLEELGTTQGNMEEIKNLPTYRHYLEYLRLCYGPLNSFYWGPRYCVSTASRKLVESLQKYKENLLAICPIAVGSVLQGDGKFWTKITADSLDLLEGKVPDRLDPTLQESVQNKKFVSGPRKLPEHQSTPEELSLLIRQIVRAYEQDLRTSKSIREVLSRPLVVVFNTEIDIDAHPVPKYIPVLIHVGGLMQKWATFEVWNEFYSSLSWIPGITIMKAHLETKIQSKIRKELRK